MDLISNNSNKGTKVVTARINPIVFILHNLDCSGANMSALNVLQGLLERGFKVVLLSRKDGAFGSKFSEIGIVVRIGGNLTTFIDEYQHNALCFICNTIMTCTEIMYIRSKSMVSKSILWLHEWWDKSMLEEQLKMRKIDNLTVDTVVKSFAAASAVVFVCEAQKRLYLDCSLYNIADSCKSKVIYVGSTTSLNGGCCDSRKIEKSNCGKPFVFLSLGIVCPRKNQIWAVRLFKKFKNYLKPNAKLIIVGARQIRDYETEYLQQLRDEIADDPHIELHDVTDDPDRFYQLADCLLFTSSNEVTPLVISEAMAWGLPVLTTSIAGIPEMVDDDKEGFLFALSDDDKAVACMHRVYVDRDLCFKMGSNGNTRYAKQFDMKICVSQWADLVHELCPPTVLVDMDGTLVDWDAHFITEWNKIYQSTPSENGAMNQIDRTKSYSMEDCVPLSERQVAIDLSLSKDFFSRLNPIEGALQALREMGDEGINVMICTSLLTKSKHCAQEKVEWVRQWLGESYVEKVVITADKSLVKGDILIDDRPIPADTCSKALWTHIVYSQPYNANHPALATRPRITDWKEWRSVILPLLGRDAARRAKPPAAFSSMKEARHSDSFESFDRLIKPNSPLHKIALHKDASRLLTESKKKLECDI